MQVIPEVSAGRHPGVWLLSGNSEHNGLQNWLQMCSRQGPGAKHAYRIQDSWAPLPPSPKLTSTSDFQESGGQQPGYARDSPGLPVQQWRPGEDHAGHVPAHELRRGHAPRRHPGRAHLLPDRAREIYDIPDGSETVTGMAIGYAGDPDSLSEEIRKRDLAPRERKPQRDFVFGAAWREPF